MLFDAIIFLPLGVERLVRSRGGGGGVAVPRTGGRAS
jgi:hypothetical protein